VDLEGRERRPGVQAAAEAAVILLDTHAVIWLAQGHRRAQPLQAFPRLHVSPVTLLEIQFLLEAGRLRFKNRRSAESLAVDERWRLDEPPASKWFVAACDFGWTRDPFDRLIAAHARVRRWKLATADDQLLEHLAPSDVIPL
jgi:PIN domain nuclease of toxin-antitoxin system